MFMFRAKAILDEISHFYPEIFNSCLESFNRSTKDLDFLRLIIMHLKNANVSIDVAEDSNTSNGIVLPLDVGWNDIGSWKSVWEGPQKMPTKLFKGKVFLKIQK